MMKSYPRLLRYAHWFNVPLLLLMMWSGVLIYWANQVYYKLPLGMVKNLNFSYRLAEGMSWHFFIMWLYGLNGSIYIAYFLYTKRWRIIFPDLESLKKLIPYTLYDLRISKEQISFEGIYNPAQRVAYTGAIFLNLLATLSGLAIYKPVQVGLLTSLLGGYEGARLVHFLCLNGLGIFIGIHVIQVIRSGWSHFRIMLTGEALELKK
jgi:thiosulfate reductase cytochrome b subunit